MSEKQQTTNLIIRLEGPALDNGIDVFELAPALLAVGTIIKESNDILNPLGKEVGINVKPFEQGSFIVEIALFAKDNLQHIMDLINSSDAKNIKELLDWIGLIGGVVGVPGLSLIGLIKWLKGKPPKKVEKAGPSEVRYTNYEDESVNISINVDNLYQNPVIHQHFYQGFGKLLEKEGIEKVESYLKEESNTQVENTKEDLPAFKGYTENPVEIVVDETGESTYETHLNFKRGSFEGEPSNWSFRKVNETITANIKDEVFLKKIKNGEIRPSAKDLLKVNLLEKRRIKGTEVLSVTYEIIEVLDYKPAQPNPSLFDGESSVE